MATDRLVKVSKGEFGIGKSYSVQQMISCTSQKYPKDGCSGSSVDFAWGKLNQFNKLFRSNFVQPLRHPPLFIFIYFYVKIINLSLCNY